MEETIPMAYCYYSKAHAITSAAKHAIARAELPFTIPYSHYMFIMCVQIFHMVNIDVPAGVGGPSLDTQLLNVYRLCREGSLLPHILIGGIFVFTVLCHKDSYGYDGDGHSQNQQYHHSNHSTNNGCNAPQ